MSSWRFPKKHPPFIFESRCVAEETRFTPHVPAKWKKVVCSCFDCCSESLHLLLAIEHQSKTEAGDKSSDHQHMDSTGIFNQSLLINYQTANIVRSLPLIYMDYIVLSCVEFLYLKQGGKVAQDSSFRTRSNSISFE